MRSVRLLTVLIAFSWWFSAPTWAMEFNLVGSTLILSGRVVDDDLARLKDHMATDKVKLVLLHKSPGGDLWNGLQLANVIRDRGLPTAVSGQCASSCGIMFLAGVERSFSNGSDIKRTHLGFHGAHSRETKLVLPQLASRIGYTLRKYTGGKFPEDLLDRTVYNKNPYDMLHFFYPGRYKSDSLHRGAVECVKPGADKPTCTPLASVDALSAGIITNSALLELDENVKIALEML
jgi:hypothetical protein